MFTDTASNTSTRYAKPSRRLQDVFGENPNNDIFGEQTEPQDPGTAPSNPFEKVETQQEQVPNPFGEVTPREDQSPQQPAQGRNPFGELSQDPNPTVPPMDTRPVVPPQSGQVPPVLPRGSEYTPDPGQIDPNPPIPGENPRPRDDQNDQAGGPDGDGGEEMPPDLLEKTDPGEITEEPEESVFDSKEEPDDSDVPPVPAPRSSRVYLPAKDPTDYVSQAVKE